MKKNTFSGHQGDVQFKSVAKLPADAKKIAHKPIALGEKSGHMHIVTGEVELFEHNGDIYATVGGDGASLQHVHESNFNGQYNTRQELTKADHGIIKFQPGTYLFGIHRRYEPFKKMYEKSLD